MSEAKFTKGEWRISIDCWADGHVSIDGFEHSAIAVVVSEMDDGSKKEELSANAHLMVVAPEMYEHIKQDIEILERQCKNHVIGSYEFRGLQLRIKSKQKLLAKARGEK